MISDIARMTAARGRMDDVRTMKPDDYYVAGRRVPAVYNGMAIGADWMSVASFMGLAGLLYVNGYGGLAYVLGWLIDFHFPWLAIGTTVLTGVFVALLAGIYPSRRAANIEIREALEYE